MSARRWILSHPKFVAGVTALLGLAIFEVTVRSCEGAETPPSFAQEIAVQTLAGAVDLGSTEWALSKGAREGNGIVADRRVRIGMKGATVFAMAGTSYVLERRGHKGAARVVRWGAVGVQVVVGALNVRTGMREARKRRGQ